MEYDKDQLQNDQGNAPIVSGTPVYDAAGDKIGDVVEHDPQSGQLILQKGWLFPRDVYVPTSAIQRMTTDGIYLSVTKDEVQSHNWESAPDQTGGGQGAGADTDTMGGGLRGDTLARDIDDQASLPLDNRGADYSADYADDGTAQTNRP
jgi:hypothetical protein